MNESKGVARGQRQHRPSKDHVRMIYIHTTNEPLTKTRWLSASRPTSKPTRPVLTQGDAKLRIGHRARGNGALARALAGGETPCSRCVPLETAHLTGHPLFGPVWPSRSGHSAGENGGPPPHSAAQALLAQQRSTLPRGSDEHWASRSDQLSHSCEKPTLAANQISRHPLNPADPPSTTGKIS